MLETAIVQIKETFGAVTHSEFVKAYQLYDMLQRGARKSILTPSGYRSISSMIKSENAEPLVEITFSTGADRPQTVLTNISQSYWDFNDMTLKTADKLTPESAILSYTNNETKCWGFVLNQALAKIYSVKVTDKQGVFYTLSAGSNKFYIDRLQAQ